MRLKISISNTLVSILCLFFGFNLFALAFSLLSAAVIGSLLIFKEFKFTIRQLWELSSGEVYDWNEQFFHLIWRYAISWCSGYFIFQLFTPIAFKFYGAEFSGKVGISIAMWTAGFSIAMSWINAIIPRINILIEQCKWSELDLIFRKSLFKAMLTMLIGGVGFLIADYLFQEQVFLFKRILSLKEMSILFICWLGQIYINSLAIYLRGHKKEPLMLISFVVALYIAISTYLCATYLSQEYFMLGFLTALVFWIPAVYKIYLKEKDNHKNILEVYHEI